MPAAPNRNRTTMTVAAKLLSSDERVRMSAYRIELSSTKTMNVATMKPKSPMRLVTKAFLPALALASSRNQNEISR